MYINNKTLCITCKEFIELGLTASELLRNGTEVSEKLVEIYNQIHRTKIVCRGFESVSEGVIRISID